MPEGFSVKIDSAEAYAAVSALLASDFDLLCEVDELFFSENASYEPSGLFGYLFTLPTASAMRANGQHLAFLPRNKDQRLAVLAAPEKHGLVQIVHNLEPRSNGRTVTPITQTA